MATHDYSETRASLLRALDKLDRTRRAVGYTQLPPTGSPRDVLDQLDGLDAMLADTAAELASARDACALAGRRGLRIVERDGAAR